MTRALVFAALLLSTLALASSAVSDPRSSLSAQARALGTDAQVQRLKARNARLLRKLGKRERQVVRLKRANRALRETSNEGPARAGLRCIHTHEGAWNDPNPPYWGGLQMDLQFQRTYGRPLLEALGTADHWPPAAQLAVGEVAFYSGRGFGAWPNTRKMCGV